jgi:hypothetical protein
MQIVYSPAVRAEAARLGIQLPETDTIEVLPAVVDMGADFGADFGGMLKVKAFGRSIAAAAKKTVLKPASKGAASGIIRGNAVAFAIKSPLVSAAAGMAAADRLLGDPKIANAAAVIRNTTALAALGDPAAKRGLVALQAVGNIRASLSAKPGQKVIQAKAPTARSVTVTRTPAQVKRMAAKTVATKKGTPNLLKRILIKLGFAKAA